MVRYNPKEIEPKWQKVWAERKLYEASEEPTKPKRYVLEYFPYPSGAAMHVGHVRNYTIGDVVARFYRMRGYNVMHPMGWDSFGLPAENYAIKHNISPKQAIAENTAKFKQQLMQMGFSYDWSREIDSSDPSYYKWTQWLFKLLFERGLAYQKESLQWWCPHDKTVLANEQVENGKCWRCGHEVEKKSLKQWFFKITDYADRLVEDLEDLDWSEAIKSMQRNWVGRSVGAEIDFKIEGHGKLAVFTTRHDTQYGVTFLALAPEHPLVQKITTAHDKEAVDAYVKASLAKSDLERQSEDAKQKTGVFTGAYAINPANDEKIPIWVADYVLMGYGTGAVMGVPAHDDRDHVFAKKYGLEIRQVLKTDKDTDFHSEGVAMNSGPYDGMRSEAMREKILQDFIAQGVAKEKVNYKIRDWLISRQRYWGAPIPIVHCAKDGAVAVPDEQLPVELPDVKSYQPTGEGTSVLASVTEWVNTTCPKCGGPAKRETDTMDGFACSSWYFLRFADPHNDKKAFDADKVKFWLPVDDYIGGAEHAVMHLLYARFWTKVMYDAKLISFDEPFSALRNHGMILAPDGRKMSKSWGNVIAPDDLISQGYGADTVRIMELFVAPWNQVANWSVEGVGGAFRFLQRLWTLVQEYADAKEKASAAESQEMLRLTHKTIAKVSGDLHQMGFNTAIAALMEAVNELYKIKAADGFKSKSWPFSLTTLVQLLAPFAPHMTEELWQQLGQKGSVHQNGWPVHDSKYLAADTMTIVVQVNGKLRAQLEMAADAVEAEIVAAARANEKVAGYLKGHAIKKSVYVPGKLVNFVV
ncbi:MAG TPA: leucine--tRNA ligase [Candidatus Saccharimonadales bacterium]|nr:leucine--tRNA ligase [Candidatus Saccharimonadales bacterium]